ncbi:putative glycosyl hydrolase [Aureobasidium pullulans]|nr:putative glycosyl hydrolase [Aureobasidium pullulans]
MTDITGKLIAVALAVAELTAAQNLTAAELANLEHYWSYGRSAPVYPTPQSAGKGSWERAHARAQALVAAMTNDEKNNITYGHASTTVGCSGVSGSVPRLGFPGICLQDAGNGVRGTDMVNGYPAGIHAGAAWNRNLAYQRAHYMGAEFKAKGVSVALGPVAGPLGKIAEGGRNWEGFSNDPYLSGQLTGETVRGLQNNVISCVKHWIGNEQETNRNPPFLVEAFNQSLSHNMDDRTLHELYAWPFQDAIRAGAGAVMCSYNRFNNSYGCQNSYTMNGVLKGELGFSGLVVSDWYAQHTGIASANAGLDLVMPSSPYWIDGNLTVAVNNGSLAQSRLDDMATRIVAAWYKLDELENRGFESPGFGMPFNLSIPHPITNARDPASNNVLFQGAVEGHVLVKNEGVLPLNKPKFLSLFGYDAIAPAVNTFQAGSFNKWSFGQTNELAFPNGTIFTDTELEYLFLSSRPASDRGPGASHNGTMITGGGSGAATPAYIDAPFDAFQRQAYEDATFLQWDFLNQDPLVNPGSEHCIVFVNEAASEGWDRPYLADPYSDELIENVAEQCNSTIVVIHNAGVRLVDRFVDHPNITAVIFAHLPGQDSGRALVEVLYGKQSPSGRLPYTVAKQASDYGNLLHPIVAEGVDYYTQDNHTEGLYIDYKHFLAHNITPRYEFGFGLTYTTFNYSALVVTKTNASMSYLPPNGTIEEGGLSTLWDVVASVSCTVANTGSVTAAEVAQLYVNIPNGPAKVLRGFGKQGIEPGQKVRFNFDLTRRDLSTWTEEGWVLQPGNYDIQVGKSVLDVQLKGSLVV